MNKLLSGFRFGLLLVPVLLCAACSSSAPRPPSEEGEGEGGGEECEADARRCVEQERQVCQDGAWEVLETCGAGTRCEPDGCVPEGCQPQCEGKDCGDDGCGSVCGACTEEQVCNNGTCRLKPATCGNGRCDPTNEDCMLCPADCGQCCGDNQCVPAHGEGCGTCPADCRCGPLQSCDPQANDCSGPCQPQCAGRMCGDDGCEGSCGDCDPGERCSALGRCVEGDPSCGDEECNGDETCQDCPGDCGECCGDRECRAEHGETCATCAVDCGGCCGNELCDQGESCMTCPADCGGCCGDGECTAAHGETCATCLADCGCPAGQTCRVADAVCVPLCQRQCAGRECGDDGCGGRCGECPGDQVCDADGQCADPPARCNNQRCEAEAGEDCSTCPADCGPCCGNGQCAAAQGENCATCPADCGCPQGQQCNPDRRQCEVACQPRCEGRECGPNGCDGVCGACDPGELCNLDRGMCEPQCVRQCQGKECGPDNCGGSCGDCAADERCDGAGQCAPICVPQCQGKECGPNGCNGVCGECDADEECTGGVCAPRCVPRCGGRECGDDGCQGSCGGCAPGEVCDDQGRCMASGLACQDCAPDQTCLDGVCRDAAQLCSPDNVLGLCSNGQDCVAGVCRDNAARCSAQNPAGLCPVGKVCHNGQCQELDGAALCHDANPCTLDFFDFRRNTCQHQPQDGAACSDGNGCTTDRCGGGVCTSTPVAGCLEPPRLDPYTTPTNVGNLQLSGTKPAGSSVQINGEGAVPESPDLTWSVSLNLVPGENVYAVRSVNQGQASEAITARIVYDITPPVTQLTPAGGVFLDGVTATAAASEPAVVYYTTDGSQPTERSASFTSARTFRLFAPTTLRFKARDLAGNWEAAVVSATFNITSADNGWSPGIDLPEPLIEAAAAADTAALYLVGGSDGLAAQAGAYQFKLADQAWTNLPALPAARSALALALSHRALYAFGGQDAGTPLNLVSRLDPATDQAWTNRRAMPSTRFGLAAVTLGDNIYVFGGKTNGDVVLDTLEVYTPSTDTWTNQVAQLPRPRYAFAAVATGGKIYLVGGEDEAGVPIPEVDVYVPASNSWEAAPRIPTPRSFVTATLQYNAGAVAGGSTGIVVSGGRVQGGGATAVVEEYLVVEQVWRARRPLPAPRHSAAAAFIEGPGVPDTKEVQGWVLGGQVAAVDGQQPEQLTPSTAWFTREQDYLHLLRPLPEGRFMHGAVALGSRIYLFGGRNFQEVTQGWSYEPETDSYTRIADLPSVQNDLAAVAFNDQVWAIGGANSFGQAVANLRSYDPVTDRWTDWRPMLNARRNAAAVVLGGKLYVIGGDNNGAVQTVEIYDPAADRWSNGTLLPEARTGAVAVTYNGDILLVGGKNAEGRTRGAILQLRNGVWSTLQDNVIPVSDATGVRLGNMLALFAGRENGTLSKKLWSYNLDTKRLAWQLLPETQLLAAYDHQAAALLHGRVFLFGGNAAADPLGPAGEVRVQQYDGRCFNGVVDPYETYRNNPWADVGGGCGNINPVFSLQAGHGWGHHGSCGSWNACNSAAGCANMACAYFGHGAAAGYTAGNCRGSGLICDIFNNPNSLEQNWQASAGCDLPIVYNVTCYGGN